MALDSVKEYQSLDIDPSKENFPVFTGDGCDRYQLVFPHSGIQFEVDRLRRQRNELIGELTVRCDLPGARAVNGCLTVGDFNFSSVRARSDRAKLLTVRANTTDLDWFGLLEEFCQRVHESERAGQPPIDLRDLPRPNPDDEIKIGGLVFPRRHPAILFGDGGSAKSYTALYLAGKLANDGFTVALFDWELSGEDHRDRLERLFPDMPRVLYCRCQRPLTAEADRLKRIVLDHEVEYAIYDSVAFACDARPEDAEVASRYFQAVRQIACGSLHIAHVNKSDDNDRKPFGSSFWHNGARSTWYVQAVESAVGGDSLRLGFFNRKSNLGALRPPASFDISFTSERTEFRVAEIEDSPDLAGKLSVRQRIAYLLRRGARTVPEIVDEIEAKAETVERTIRRYKHEFVAIEGGRIGLKGKQHE